MMECCAVKELVLHTTLLSQYSESRLPYGIQENAIMMTLCIFLEPPVSVVGSHLYVYKLHLLSTELLFLKHIYTRSNSLRKHIYPGPHSFFRNKRNTPDQ
jgi:hypothetical protein